MAVLRLFIDNIEDVTRVTTELEKLGQVSKSQCAVSFNLIISGSSHFHRGIKSEYIDVMGPVFCNTIRKVLLRIIQFDELETNFKRRPILVRKELWSLELEEVRNTYFVQKV